MIKNFKNIAALSILMLTVTACSAFESQEQKKEDNYQSEINKDKNITLSNKILFNKNDENTFTNRSAFQQRDNVEAKVNFTQHKNTVNMHRPMTSEGGRRKRAAGNLQTNGDRQQ